MCQFTPKDRTIRHRAGTVCPVTGQVAGGGCGGEMVVIIVVLALAAAGSGVVPLP